MTTAKRTDKVIDQTFMLTMDSVKLPLVVTQMALDDFEIDGLAAMDDLLARISDRHTPANAPELRPMPLDLVGQMMVDGMSSGNTRKVMVCALWLGHHYPSLNGLVSNAHTFGFTQTDSASKRSAVTG